MFAAFHFPGFELHCLLASDEVCGEFPAALLSSGEREKAHVTALNGAAAECGVSYGMSSLAAMARCGEIRFLERDEEIEKEVLEALKGFAESLTPDFELTGGNTILLNLSTLVFASERDWVLGSLSKARVLRLPVHVAIAETPDLAQLCALSTVSASSLGPPPEQVVRLQLNTEDVRELAIADLLRARAFSLSRANQGGLELWGIRTVGDLAELSRQGLAERLGAELTWLHDVVSGKKRRLLRLYQPEVVFELSHDFEVAVVNFDPILFVSRRLFQTLCRRLKERQRSAAAVWFQLLYEDGFAYVRTLHLSETTTDVEVLLRALHTQLDAIKASAPVCSFSLRILPELASHKQHEMFKRGIKDAHRFNDTLQRLSNMVGSDRLGVPQLEDSHRPDCFRMNAVSAGSERVKAAKIHPPGYLPMARFRPPIRVEVLSEKRGERQYPLAILTGPYRGEISKTRGPYPVSGNWWEHGWQEMQWDVEISKNRLMRLCQMGDRSWLLHGMYGG